MKSVVYIIFNPNSTGDGQKNATELEQRLKKHSITTHVLPTKRAGHAYQLAKTHAGKNHIIISSSGDGGFHEVVGGVLNSSHPETVVGVLPSGNANDHYHARHRGSLITRIKTRDTDTQDVICIRHGSKTYFGHSYAGLGLSADTGKTLTEHDLNRLTESWLVIKHLGTRPVKPILLH